MQTLGSNSVSYQTHSKNYFLVLRHLFPSKNCSIFSISTVPPPFTPIPVICQFYYPFIDFVRSSLTPDSECKLGYGKQVYSVSIIFIEFCLCTEFHYRLVKLHISSTDQQCTVLTWIPTQTFEHFVTDSFQCLMFSNEKCFCWQTTRKSLFFRWRWSIQSNHHIDGYSSNFCQRTSLVP